MEILNAVSTLTRDATRMTADAVIFFTLFFGRLARGPSEPNFNYTTSHAICQQAFYTNFHRIFFPILCILTIDFWFGMWYNIYSQEGVSTPTHKGVMTMRKQAALVSLLKNIKENFRNPLTKPPKCGIIYTVKRGNAFADICQSQRNLQKIFEKLFKNLLTKSQKCGIIYTSRGDARWHRVPHDAKGSNPYADEHERPSKKFLKNFSKTS